jgi:hypothetical protein
MPQAVFADFKPDAATFDSPFTAEAVNVYPIEGGFAPVKGEAYTISFLPDDTRPRGIVEFMSNDVLYRFLGSPDQLQLYNVATNVFEFVSWPNGYNAPGRWGYSQYGTYAIATNGFDSPQRFVMGTGTNFRALKGAEEKPFLRTAVHKDFLFGIWNDPSGLLLVANSAIGNPEIWDGTLLSDEGPIPEGGPGTGILAGEAVLVFQRNRIHRFVFTGDPNAPFQRDEIQTGRGCVGPDACAISGADAFFLADDGFYKISFSGLVTPIGAGSVNRYFFNRANIVDLPNVICRGDPRETRVYWRYRSKSAPEEVYDEEIGYDWALDKWYRITGLPCLDVWDFITQDWVLEDFDPIYEHLEDIPGSFDDRIWQGGDVLRAIIGVQGRMIALGGANLDARLETAPLLTPNGIRKQITRSYPICDATETIMQIGTQERLFEQPNWSEEQPANITGAAQWNVAGRAVRARLTIPKAALWTRASGIDVSFGTSFGAQR